MQRWPDIRDGVHALAEQSLKAAEVVLVVDDNAELAKRARTNLMHVLPTLQVREFSGGVSAARNLGLQSTGSELVAFLDDDARPAPNWLEQLIAPFEDTNVMIVGGQVLPNWPTGDPPRWFPAEFLWVVGASYNGLPTEPANIRNPIGASMAARRAVLATVGGFVDAMGRGKGIDIGCEETDLAIRVKQTIPEAAIVYQPSAVVYHRVTQERTAFAYFVSRCLREGRSKAYLRAATRDGLAPERAYAARVLPQAFARYVKRGLTGDIAGVECAGALVAGLVTTSAAYGVSWPRASRQALVNRRRARARAG
jgi:GT2 family glycosyltransferase